MKQISIFLYLILLSSFLSACGSGSDQPSKITGSWEQTDSDTKLYVFFNDSTVTSLYYIDYFECYLSITTELEYLPNSKLQTSNGPIVSFALTDNQLTITNDSTAETEIYTATSISQEDLPSCGDSSEKGSINVTVTFDYLPTSINADANTDFEIQVNIDVDNSGGISVGDMNFTAGYYTENTQDIETFKLEGLYAHIGYVYEHIETSQGTSNTRYVSIANPKLITDTENGTVTFSILNNQHTKLKTITSEAGVKVDAEYLNTNINQNDSFPNSGYIDLVNLEGSVDAIGDAYNKDDSTVIVDIKSLSIELLTQ